MSDDVIARSDTVTGRPPRRFGAIVSYTLRSCLPPKRRAAMLLPCIGALLFGLLAHAVDDTATAAQGVAAPIPVLANDSDPDGSPLRGIAGTPNADDGTTAVIIDEATVDITPPDEPGRYAVRYTIQNEYGGTSGVVTLEDLVEEIVGEVQDEHDPGEQRWRREADGRWTLSGLLRPDEVQRATEIRLPEDEDYETIAGLLADRLARGG